MEAKLNLKIDNMVSKLPLSKFIITNERPNTVSWDTKKN